MINKHIQFDLKGYISELAGMPCRDQLRTAQAITRPLDYVEDTLEQKIIDNADLIAKYVCEYDSGVEKTTQLREFLAQQLGENIIDMLNRHE